MAKHNELGKIGEEIAVKHLMKHGFKILERNYRKKWGEIDIIAIKKGLLHFVEVKTVSYETDFDNYIPEENVNYSKRKKLTRAINTYLVEKGEIEFQVDVIAVYFDSFTKNSRIRVLENVIL